MSSPVLPGDPRSSLVDVIAAVAAAAAVAGAVEVEGLELSLSSVAA